VLGWQKEFPVLVSSAGAIKIANDNILQPVPCLQAAYPCPICTAIPIALPQEVRQKNRLALHQQAAGWTGGREVTCTRNKIGLPSLV